MKMFYQIRSKAQQREQKVFNLFQALSLACHNANSARDSAVIVACIKRADNLRTSLVAMGELPETSR